MGYEQEVGCGKSVIYRINDVCVSVIIDYQNLLFKILKLPAQNHQTDCRFTGRK